MTPCCRALLNCHMSFFEGRIVFLVSCYSCNGVKLAVLLYFAFLLTRHTRSNLNPLMSVSPVLYNNTVGKLSEDFFLTTFHGINWVILFPIYKEARAKAYYPIEIIKAAFKVTVIFLLNPRVVLSQFLKPTANSCRESRADATCILEYTPYTKYDLW